LNVIKKVLCSAEKSSVIWAEAHSRSSAKLNVRSVTKTVKVGYKLARKGKKENEPKYTNVNTAQRCDLPVSSPVDLLLS